ncbi:TIGR04255 family protein [Actinoplanes sp. LDG1-06]|uniref:TIGR04255 family protein n=1 Tax=Paractinoplanes ovalisporus TaxID=2810368 RepID=A0ABS2A5B7_9ACTN|nr:TIGR04255 family protein [Actinoplanes ovalisporus]MBM2615040.1 TIGR04255 family protein [Actinoplanes ovalisporus]
MFNLEPVRQYKLLRPPLAQALAQVRFPIMARLHTLEGIAGLQEVLAPDFPYMDRVTEMAIAVGPTLGLEAQPEQAVVWHFTNDHGHLLIVGSNVVTLSVADQYAGIGNFSAMFERVLTAIKQTLNPRRCDRVAVRFLDVVDDAEGGWKDWFNQDLVGWSSSETVRGDTQLVASVSQIQLASPPVDQLATCHGDVQAVVRHGVANSNSVIPGLPPVTLQTRSFFLDMDLFVAVSQPFDSTPLVGQFRAMHSQIDRFFRWTLTPAGEKRFGLEER